MVDMLYGIFYCLKIQITGLTFNYVKSPDGALVALSKLIKANKYNILFYSGDADSVVPYIDTLKRENNILLQISNHLT